MAEIRVLEPERVVEWVRAWAELEWPVSWETAFAVRDRLGWEPAMDDGCFFTTELSVNGEEDGSIYKFENEVAGMDVALSSQLSTGESDELSARMIVDSFEADINALENVYGRGTARDTEDRKSVRWVLSNRVTVDIGGSPYGIRVYVESPRMTALDELEDYYVEKYGEAYFEGEDV